MKVKVDATNYGSINGVFVFPETHKEYLARLRKISYTEFIKYKKHDRIDDLNSKKRELLAQWYDIDHCIAME